MPRTYKKIKYEDRLRIQKMCSEGLKPKEIAEEERRTVIQRAIRLM